MEETLVAEVVQDISERMKQPNYAQVAVGNFVQEQPELAQFLSAKLREGSGESIIHAVFHAELIAECFRRKLGTKELRSVGFAELNAAAGGDAMQLLAQRAEALSDYLTSNVDDGGMREAIALVALAISHAHG